MATNATLTEDAIKSSEARPSHDGSGGSRNDNNDIIGKHRFSLPARAPTTLTQVKIIVRSTIYSLCKRSLQLLRKPSRDGRTFFLR